MIVKLLRDTADAYEQLEKRLDSPAAKELLVTTSQGIRHDLINWRSLLQALLQIEQDESEGE